jgi:hypothetical protein
VRCELGPDDVLAGEAVLAGGEFDKLTNVFCAAAAAAGIFQAELGFDLARHHNPGTPGITDIRLGDSLAQAYIHERPLPVTIMRSILSMPERDRVVKGKKALGVCGLQRWRI